MASHNAGPQNPVIGNVEYKLSLPAPIAEESCAPAKIVDHRQWSVVVDPGLFSAKIRDDGGRRGFDILARPI